MPESGRRLGKLPLGHLDRMNHTKPVDFEHEVHRPGHRHGPQPISQGRHLQQANHGEVAAQLPDWLVAVENRQGQQGTHHHIHGGHDKEQFPPA